MGEDEHARGARVARAARAARPAARPDTPREPAAAVDGVEHDRAHARRRRRRCSQLARRPRPERGARPARRSATTSAVGRARGGAGRRRRAVRRRAAAPSSAVDRAARRPRRRAAAATPRGERARPAASPVAIARRAPAWARSRPATSTSWLPSTGYHGARRPGRAERPLRGGEQAGVAGRVDVRAGSRTDRGRPPPGRRRSRGAPRVGVDASAVAAPRAPASSSLRLGVVDQVAGLDDRVRARSASTDAHGGGQHLRGERLLRAEGGGERAAEAVEERRRAPATPRRGRGRR